MTECQQKQSSQLQLLTSDSFIFQLKTTHSAILKLESAVLSAALSLAAEFSQYTFIHASIASSSCHVALSSLSAEHEMSLSFKYHMCCMIRTVKTLWCEWTIDLAGNSSVDMLNSKWDSQWQADCQSKIQWYLLRLEIIKEIRHIAQAQRTSEKAAMWQINQLQERMNCSLDQLCKQLWADRKIAV